MKTSASILLIATALTCALTAHDLNYPMICGTESTDTDDRSCASTGNDVCMKSEYPMPWICKTAIPALRCSRFMVHTHDEVLDQTTGEVIDVEIVMRSENVTYTYKEGTCVASEWQSSDDNGNPLETPIAIAWTCEWGQPANRTCSFDHTVGTEACPPPAPGS